MSVCGPRSLKMLFFCFVLFCFYPGSGYMGVLDFQKYIKLYTYDKCIFLCVYYSSMKAFMNCN